MQDTPQTTRPGVAFPSFGSTILALGPGARLVRELQSGSPLKFNYYSRYASGRYGTVDGACRPAPDPIRWTRSLRSLKEVRD